MSLRPDSRGDRRKKGFKKGIDAEESKKKRDDDIVALRKSARDESLQAGHSGGGLAVLLATAHRA